MSKKIIGGLVIAIEFGQVTIWAQWAIKALPQWAAVVMVVMGAMKFLFVCAVVIKAWEKQGVVQYGHTAVEYMVIVEVMVRFCQAEVPRLSTLYDRRSG